MILTDPEWQAVLLSLKVSSLAVLFSLPFGIFFAWLLVRCRFPGKALLDSVLHLPLVLPPVVVGYLLLVSMGRRGFIGQCCMTGSVSRLPLAGAAPCWRRR
ncbi:molybdenum transporter permease ModB [Salmonella enterica subsp. enterica]|nr:molybdenum transporter permease ModB [Salmonella enterica subsp. enterica]